MTAHVSRLLLQAGIDPEGILKLLVYVVLLGTTPLALWLLSKLI